MKLHCLTLMVFISFGPAATEAGITTAAIREAAEVVARKFGREVAQEGIETLTKRTTALAARFGDEGLIALKKTGPRVLTLLENTTDDMAPTAVKLLSRFGDEAVRLVGKPTQLHLVNQFGDEAAEALVRHGDLAEDLIVTWGEPAAKSLNHISSQNARRLAMMTAEGTLDQIGRTDELLAVVAKLGDGAADVIWRNKGVLLSAAVVSAFISSPEPFVTGAVDLVSIATEATVAPLSREAAKSIPWSLLASLSGLLLAVTASLWLWSHRHVVFGDPMALSRSPLDAAREVHPN